MPHASNADEAAFVESSRTQPQAKAIVHQHLHSIGAFVHEQVRMMSTRLAEHIHDAGERSIHARHACRAARPRTRPHRCGSLHQLAQQHRALARRRCRPRDTDTVPLAAQLDADRAVRRALTDSGTGTKVSGRSRLRLRGPSGLYRDRFPLRSASLHPMAQHVRIEPSRQRHRRNRYARLLAGPNRFRLEHFTVAPASPTADSDHLF